LRKIVLSGVVPVDQPQRDLWLVTAWLLSPNRYGGALQGTSRSRPEIVFDLRDFAGYSRNEAAPGLTSSLGQIEFLIRLAGSLYPPTGYPSGGWGGDRNAWDAADYVRGLVNGMSATATPAATDALSRLESDVILIYRMFWNLDGHGRLVSPRPEEACRDDLITLLRQRLAPLGISLEPEGHMAGDRPRQRFNGQPAVTNKLVGLFSLSQRDLLP